MKDLTSAKSKAVFDRINRINRIKKI